MTIIEAIQRVDSMKPNGFSQSDKIRWLSTLDGIVKNEIIDTHEGVKTAFAGYDDDTDTDTVLLVPAPYDDIYIHYLEAQIDYALGEYSKYNNTMTAYNNTYLLYRNFYNATHKPVSHGRRFLF